MSKQWLIDPIDEYTTENKRPAGDRIRRLDRLYANESPAAMQLATLDYMRSGARFFPRVGDLVPYVTKASQLFGRLIRPDLMSDSDRDRVDEAFYSVEVSDGMIDPLASSADEDESRRKLAAWGTCPACGEQMAPHTCPACAGDTGRIMDKETAVRRSFKRIAADGERETMATL